MTLSYLRRAETLLNELSVTVQGDENSIVDFNATLLNSLPETEAIGRKPTDDNLGDATLELRFRSLMSVEQAIRALEEMTRETGAILST